MDLNKLQISLEALARHLDEVRHSVVFQIASDEQFVRTLLMAPAQIAEHRRERDRCSRRKDLLNEQIALQEDVAVDMAYSEGLIDGTNATIRSRQERQVLREDSRLASLRNDLRGVEQDLRETETLYDQSRHEFQASMAILRDASAKLEWLGWLA